MKRKGIRDLRGAEKIKINGKEYMCTQIFIFKDMRLYRMHNVIESGELFLIEKERDYEVITDGKFLNEIYKFLEVKNTDQIIKY